MSQDVARRGPLPATGKNVEDRNLRKIAVSSGASHSPSHAVVSEDTGLSSGFLSYVNGVATGYPWMFLLNRQEKGRAPPTPALLHVPFPTCNLTSVPSAAPSHQGWRNKVVLRSPEQPTAL